METEVKYTSAKISLHRDKSKTGTNSTFNISNVPNNSLTHTISRYKGKQSKIPEAFCHF